MSIWLAVAGLFLFIAVGAAGAAWYFGPERAWRLLGPADLGPVDFETLQRRPRPTDALLGNGFADAEVHGLIVTET
jgi:hypothetical protein